MSLRLMIKSSIGLTLGICFLALSCGKKVKDIKPPREVISSPQTDHTAYLEKQDVNCEVNQACPNFIAKIVVLHAKEFKFCTGFLTDERTVATSASCLPSILRLNGQNCSKDVFFFFPKTANRPAERVGCSNVTLVSQLDGQDPVLWRDDVAFLEMNRPLFNRRKAVIDKDEGIPNRKQFTAWMVDQQDDFSAIIKRSTCESVHNNYVNPLVLNESSPNMMFADCAITNGSTGAPVIDSRNKVRAMISKTMDKKLRAYLESTGLLTAGLKEIFHASNFACAATPTNDDLLDEKECLKDLTYQKVDRLRSEMLSTNLLFGELRKILEDSLLRLSKYVQFGVKLIPKGDLQKTEIYPKCFKPLEGWLYAEGNRNTLVDDVMLPDISFRRSMDPYGRIKGLTLEGIQKLYLVQMSLKNLRAVKRSTILMWQHGVDDLRTFPSITESCSKPGSLL